MPPDLTDGMEPKPICHIVTPVGQMGYGFDEGLMSAHLAKLVPTDIPTAIILDSGSTDSGPYKLALGSMTCPKSAYVRDLTKLVKLIHTFRVPLIFSSAGGDGADEHVRVMGEIIEEIAAEEQNKDYCFKTISIFSNIDKSTIVKRLNVGRVTGCGVCVPQLTERDVESAPWVVAQIGPEPFVDAMEANPDFNIIIGGRAYDPAPYAAYALFQLKQQSTSLDSQDTESCYGGFLHMGKMMECGGQCSTPKSHGAIATVYSSGLFDITPLAAGSRCTPFSVAAHSLYENARPDILCGPGGDLHLEDSKYEQLEDGRTVRVSGSKYQSSKADGLPYQLKLEGACVVGYRSMFMGSVKDHILIGQIDNLLARVKGYVGEQHPDNLGKWDLGFHLYGKGQSMASGPGEIFIVAEALAPTQQLANSIASNARIAMIHGAYPGQKATAGNFAFGICGSMEIEMGPCPQFCVYHLMELDPGEERLGAVDKTSGLSKKEGRLLHASVAVIGRGQPVTCNKEFRATIVSLQNTIPKNVTQNLRPNQDTINKHTPANPPRTLSDASLVLRSKNAGPFEITMDVIFNSKEIYHWIKESSLLTRDNVARSLGIAEEEIIWLGFFETALAFKVTIPRFRGGKRVAAGGFMEYDVHGSQQHLGLAALKLPCKLVPSWNKAFGGRWFKFLVFIGVLGSVSTAKSWLPWKKLV